MIKKVFQLVMRLLVIAAEVAISSDAGAYDKGKVA